MLSRYKAWNLMELCICCPNNEMTKHKAILSGKLNFRGAHYSNGKKLPANTSILKRVSRSIKWT